MGHNNQMEQEGDRPKWLLELENRKRKPRLAHEVGAGAPCTKCTTSCPGLDLHFWRKICKNCKCSRDDHDIPDTEFPQFDLLFGPSGPPKKRSIILKRKSNEETFEWAPPDTTKELATDYMKALPEDKLPIKGTAGALFRKQQLQKQLPLHDIDHKVCDELSDSERKQFEKYLENLKNFVGQGKVTKFVTARPFDRSLMTPANASECFSPKHKTSVITSNSPNLRTPSSFVPKKYDQSSPLSRDRSPSDFVANDSSMVSAKREALQNPGFHQLNEATKLGRYHHALANVKANGGLAESTSVPGLKNPAMNLPTINRVGDKNWAFGEEHHGPAAQPVDPHLQHLRNPQGHVAHSDPLKKPMTPGLFAPLNSHENSSSNSLPYQPQMERISAKSDHAVDDQKPLRSHQWAKCLKPNGPLSSDDNSILADQMLTEALLPPSSINSNDIIGSTLDEKGLSYIREMLSSKYGDREESSDCHRDPMGAKELDAVHSQARNVKDALVNANANVNVNARPVASQLKTYGGAHAGLVHSESLQNPVFPEEAVLRAMGHSTVIDRLGSNFENMSVQSTKQNCHQCKEDIVLGDVIVTAERAKDAAWHPGCFVCSVCDELLVDLVYFYHKGKLYCGRDFAGLLEIPRCFACDELIFVREYTVAEGHNYHVKHFCCWDCDIPLAGQQYISENDRPLCLPCYQKTYAKTCSACNKVIAADQQGVAVKNLDFHASNECFCCANCKKSLLNGRMAIKENKPFCSKECITTYLNKTKN